VSEAKSGIGKYFAFYNARRSHTALDRKAPDHIYFKSAEPPPLAKAA
jgi:putative transposase